MVSCGAIANGLSVEWALPELIRKSAPTMTRTVPMCHHTDASFSSATIRMPAMLRASWMSSSTAMVTSWPLTRVPRNIDPFP